MSHAEKLHFKHVFHVERTMANYFCHSENSNSSKVSAGAGCGEEGGVSNDLWFGSHAYSADFTHHSYLNSQNRPLGTQPRESREEKSYISQLRVIRVLEQLSVQVMPILQTVFTVQY